jgi:hypothetical protein
MTPTTSDFRDFANAPKKSFVLLAKRAVFISYPSCLKLLEQLVTVTVFPCVTLYDSTIESNKSRQPITYWNQVKITLPSADS